MKALIVYRVDRSEPSNIGVIKKLIGTKAGLEKNNFKVDYIIHDKSHICYNEKIVSAKTSITPTTIFKWFFYKQLLQLDLFDYDLYIVRYGVSTAYFSTWLSKIRSQNVKAKIVIDMPTYPYAKEWRGIKGKIVLLFDNFYKRQLNQYVDFVLHSGEEEEIFGIPTLKYSNGIDVKNIKPRSRQKIKGYHFLSLAKFQYWHGLDRLLYGLKVYLKNEVHNVKITLVGEGPRINSLKKLSKELGLEEYVSFVGFKSGAELDVLIDQVDLGIGTLAIHRKGVMWDSSLKHREYVARALPFVMSGQDVDIKKELPFVYVIEPNESYVDIKALLNFIDRLDHIDITPVMRSFAISHLSWAVKTDRLIKQMDFEEA